MASFSENISRIKTRLTESITSIVNKGGTIAEDAKTVNLASAINNIPITYTNPNGTYWEGLGDCFSSNNANFNGYRIFKGHIPGLLIGISTTTTTCTVYSLDNGDTWRAVNISNLSKSSSPIAYGNGIYVLQGRYYSTDNCATWIQSSAYSNITNIFYPGSYQYIEVKYGNGVWVLGNCNYSNTAMLFYSTDGNTWTKISGISGIVYYLECVNNVWFISLQSKNTETSTTEMMSYYSHDGINWTKITLDNSNDYLARVKYYNGRYVSTIAMNNNMKCKYSENLTDWISYDSDEEKIFCVAYDNNMWISFSFEKGFKYSYDGDNWFETSGYPIGTAAISKITYQDDMWIAYCNMFASTGLFVSYDGVNWINIPVMNRNFGYHSIVDIKHKHGIFLILTSSSSSASIAPIYYTDDIINGKLYQASKVTLATANSKRYTGIIESGNKWILQQVNGYYYINWDESNSSMNANYTTCSAAMQSIIWAPEETTTASEEIETTE